MKFGLKKKNRSLEPEDFDGMMNEESHDAHTKSVLKPDDQLQLSEQEYQYKQIPQVDQMIVHYHTKGYRVHCDTELGRQQLSKRQTSISETSEPEDEFGAENGDKGTVDEDESKEKFNMTDAPSRSTYSANVTQWSIYDAYKDEHEQQAKDKEDQEEIQELKLSNKPKNKMKHAELQIDDLSHFAAPLKILERMVNQNTHDELAQDFKYYEDPSDEFREDVGTLLPLWNFSYGKSGHKHAVTSLCWSPKYPDLFAVGHGSYDFMKQGGGLICFYTLKNSGYPEYMFETKSGVLTLDIHPTMANMLCVGFYNGSVGVYNINLNKPTPLYLSSVEAGKHTEPVWEVRWQPTENDANLNFYSISADGFVKSWTIIKKDLSQSNVLKIQLPTRNSSDQSQLVQRGCGTSFTFHPLYTHQFLIATEEGMVYLCSKAFTSECLGVYQAHHMAVYRVAWNVFHPAVFITCSADWSVKIWHKDKTEPMFVFDLGASVSDVAWAPYSSTVFAAVTWDGRAYVYDLNVNKYDPICKQVVTAKKRSRPTHLAFNPIDPVLIIGDDHGQVISMKLSPNLRKMPKEKKGIEQQKGPDLEIQKLETILKLVA